MGIHVNPLKKKVVRSINPGPTYGTDTDEHMSYRDAALVAIILTMGQIFTSFLSVLNWADVVADPSTFVFNIVKFAGATFFSTFILLSGMARYLSK